MCFFLLAAKCPSMYLKWNKEIENLRHELPIKVRYNKPHVSLILLLVPPHWAESFPTHRATPNMMIHSKSHWWVSERESSLFDDENHQRFIQKAEECREASDERFFGAKLRRSSCFGFALSRTAKKQHKKLLESSQLFFEGVSCDSDVTELNESLSKQQWFNELELRGLNFHRHPQRVILLLSFAKLFSPEFSFSNTLFFVGCVIAFESARQAEEKFLFSVLLILPKEA